MLSNHAPADTVREGLATTASVAVLTGAGISAEGGIPTFRGPGGLWRTYRAEDLATPHASARDPHRSCQWYHWRRAIIATAQPHTSHATLARPKRRPPSLTPATHAVGG